MPFMHANGLRTLRLNVLIAVTMLLAACTTSPTSGRAQFNLLPGQLESTISDLRFDVKTLLTTSAAFCGEGERDCAAREAAEKLSRRVAYIADRLGSKVAELSPEMVSRVPHVEVFVVPGDSPSVSSSAGGRIAVEAGLAHLDLSDTDLAFALAREFGRLAAAHHRESASAGLAVSLVAGSPLTSAYLATTLLADIVFPMGALAKLGISLLASMGTEQLVEASQQDEADAFAAKLMLAAGYDLKTLADPRQDTPLAAVRIGWPSSYIASRAKVGAMAQPDPWPDEAPAPLVLAAAADPWPDEAPPSTVMALDPWPDEALALPVSSAEPLKPGRQNSATKIAARSVDPGPAVAEIQQAQVATAKAGRTTVQGSKKPVAKQAKKNKRISKTARKKAAQR
ncbi:MAG: M48 family metalloprotease [Rhodocyclaceae bacterium]|jgi:Zn-dependent protease with chaperone function|nr:M48 family metalloprotease [Rhodocyclaceae bacterium]